MKIKFTVLRFSLLAVFSLVWISSNAQTYYINQAPTTVNTCKGLVVSSYACGTPANPKYCNGENYTRTFCSSTGGPIRINFILFDTELNYDFVRIYDGPSTASPLIATISGFFSNPNLVFTSTGSCLTIRFSSDASFNYEGFQAILGCAPAACGTNALAGDNCTAPTPICNLNGYCGTTSGWYTPDETSSLLSNFCGSIENNSWLSFVANATTASLSIASSNCSSTASGIQAAVFSSTGCNTYTLKSNCLEQSTGPGTSTLTATGLTVGQTYYLMVDGFAGNNCDYTVTATSGVLTVNVTASANTICQGQSTTLTANASGATGYSWSPGGQTTSSINVSPAATTTYTVTITGACGASTTTSSTITVNPTPAAPTATGTTICSGNTATLTATAPGGTYQWYTASSGGTLLATSASYTTPSLSSTTTYYVQTTVSGCTSPRTPVTVTVTPTPAAPTAAGTTICSGNTATITATAPGGSYAWYSASSGGTLLGSTAGYTTPILTTTITYYVQTTVSGCTSARTPVTVTVNPIPAAPTAPGATICSGNSTTVTATAPGGSYQWYSAASGGTLLASAAGYTTPVLTGTTTYYVQTTVSGCTSPRTAVTVTVNPIPAAPTAAGTTICSGNTSTLTATAPGGTYAWYTASTGGSLLATATSYTTPTLTSTTTYYVQTTVSGCVSSRTPVTVTVTPIPAAPTAAGTTICSGNTATLTATAPGGSYAWYSASSGGTLLASTAGYTTPTLTGTTTYYVQTTVSGCTSPRTPVTVTVNPIPAAPTAPGATICSGNTTTLTATAPGGTYAWYTASTGGTLLATATNYTTPSLTSTTTYYVQTTVSGCTSSRTPVTVTVTPIPAAPTAAGTSMCGGNTATLTATAPGGTYQWYTASSGGTLLSTGASYTSPVLTSTTTYYVQTTVSGCTSPRTAVTVNVTPTDNPAFNYSASTYCKTGTNPSANITGGATGTFSATPAGLVFSNTSTGLINLATSTANTYTITFNTSGICPSSATFQVTITTAPSASFSYSGPYCKNASNPLPTFGAGASGGTFSSTAGLVFVNTSTGQIDLNASTAGSYTVTNDIPAGGGCMAASANATVTITATPAAPTAAGTTICSGATASLNATAPGGSYQWFDAVTAGTLLSSTSAYTTPALTSSTTYYVETTVSGCKSPRTPVAVTVNPIPAAPTASGTTICAGNTTSLTATAPGGSYEWYDAASGGSLVSSSATFTTPILSSTTTYYVQSTISGCTSARTPVIVNVTPVPAAPTANGTTICSGSNATLTATAPGGSYDWYSASTGGTFLSMGASYTTPNLTTTTNYYVETTVSGCTSVRTTVTVTVNSIPANPTANDETICSGNTAILTATAPGGTYDWYDASSGGTLLFTGTSYTTPSLTGTTTYYVQSTIAGCTGNRSAVEVTVNPIPAAPTAPGITICSGNTANLTASAPGGTYEWFDAASGGTLLFTGSNFVSPVLTSNATYYVQTTISGCTSPRTTVTIIVNPVPSAPTAADISICSGSTATLNATAPGGTYDWYNASSGGTLLSTGASYTTPALTASTTYYVQTTITGCTSTRTAVDVTVNPIPTAPTAAGATICAGTTASLSASAPGGTYDWFDAASGGTLLFTGANFTTPILSGTTTYYVQTTISGCTSSRTAVVVTVTPLPANPTAPDATICSGNTASIIATAPGGTYEWFDAATGGTLLSTGSTFTTPVLTSSAIYYVQTTISGCTSGRTLVNVTVNPNPVAPTANDTSICAGSTATLNAAAPGGLYGWYDAATGGTLLASGSSYTTSVLGATTIYYVQTIISGCTSPRTAVTVTVNQIPAAPTAPGATICSGNSTTLTATAPGGVYTWYDAATGGALLFTGPSFTTPVLTSVTTYYVEATIAGCTSPRTAVVVTVNPIPAAPTAANKTICSGSTATLNATAPGGTYTWYDAASGGTLLSTGSSFTTPSLTSPTTYYVQTTISGCVSPRTAVTVSITPVPAAPTALGTTICEGETATLNATAPGGSYDWFNASTGGTLLASGSSYTTPSLTTTTSYFVQTTVSGCTSVRTEVIITVNPIPAAPTAASATICSGNTASLTATAPGGTYEWYNAPTGGTLISTGANFTTPVLTSSTTYYLQTTVSGCVSLRTNVVVTVNPIPAAPTAANKTICEGSTATLNATAPGGTYTWYDASTGGTLLSTGAAFTTPSLTTPTTYYVQTTISGCTSVRKAVTVSITPNPAAPTASNATICSGETATLEATAPGGSYDWFTASTGGTLLASGSSYTTPSLTSTTTYYVQTIISGCTSIRTAVTVNVTPIPAAPTVAGTTICSGTNTTLSATAPGGSYEWYNSSVGGTLLNSGTNFTSPNLTSTTTYYIQTTVAGCTSPRSAVVVNVTPRDNANFTYPSGSYCVSGTNPIATITGLSGGTFTSTPAGLVFVDNTTGEINLAGSTGPQNYVITYTTNGTCPNTKTFNLSIVTNPTDPTFTYAGPYCKGTLNPLPTFTTGSAGIFSSTSGVVFIDASTGEIDLASTPAGTHTITNSIGATSGCAPTSHTEINITIYDQPDASFSGLNANYCLYNSAVTLNPVQPGGVFSGPGITGNSFDPSIAGANTHQIKYLITNAFGCKDSVIISTVVNPTPNSSFTGLNSPYCISASSTTLSPSKPGGTFSGPGVSGNSFDPSSAGAGNHQIKYLISALGCSDSTTKVVTVNPLPNATFTGLTSPYCERDAAVTLTAATSGGTFSGPGITGNVFTPFSAGPGTTHVITHIVDSLGCTDSAKVNVTVNPTIIAGFNYSASTFCKTGTNPSATIAGAVTGNFTSSTGVVFIDATTGEIDLSNTTIGNHSVTFTTVGNCPDDSTVSITITNSPDATFSYATPFCTGSGSVMPSFSGSASAGVFGSTPGLVINAGNGQIDLNSSTPGNYNVTNTISVTGCATATDTKPIVINALPTATITASTDTICEGNTASIQIDLTGAGPWDFTYFDGTSSTAISPQNSSPYIFNIGIEGTYTITSLNDANCSNTVSDIVNLVVLDSIRITNLVKTCNASNTSYVVTFEITGGDSSTYFVTGSTGTISVSAPYTFTSDPIPTGNSYSFTVNDFYNCFPATTSGTHTCFCPASAVISGGGTICNDGTSTATITINLTGTAPWDFIYTDGITPVAVTNNSTNPYTFTSSTNTTYSLVTVTDGSGCNGSVSGSSQVIVIPLPDASFSGLAGPYCRNEAALTLTPVETGGSFTGPGVSGNSFSPSLAGTGNHPITYTVTKNGCTNDSSLTVQINALPDSSFTGLPSSICIDGTPVTLTATNSGVTSSFTGNGISGNTFDPSIAGVGNHSITYNVTDLNNCSNNSVQTIIVNALPTAIVTGGGTSCAGTDAPDVIFNMTGTSPWAVTFSDGTTTLTQTINSNPFNITNPGAGVYNITGITDGNGCSNSGSGSATVIINSLPIIDASSVLITNEDCGANNGSITGITASGNGTLTYTWLSDTGIVNNSILTADLTNVPGGNYSIVVTDINNCQTTNGPHLIGVNSGIVANFTATPDSGGAVLPVTFTNLSTGPGTLSFFWNFDDESSSTVKDPKHLFKEDKDFNVSLIAKNEFGCSDTAYLTIKVKTISNFEIPNVFTPNGDGLNDIFNVKAKGLKSINAVIYDRWGIKIFEWNAVNQGWDGKTQSGVDCSDGTYFYIISATGMDGVRYPTEGTYRGHVQLTR